MTKLLAQIAVVLKLLLAAESVLGVELPESFCVVTAYKGLSRCGSRHWRLRDG